VKIWERVLYGALLSMCAITFGLRIADWFGLSRATALPQSAVAASIAAGKAFNGKELVIPGADLPSKPVVALFINEECHFCQASLPFYRSVSKAHHEHPEVVDLTVLSIDPVEKTRAFLKREGIQVDHVYEWPAPNSIALRATPTLIAAGSDRLIKRAYVGLLDANRQGEFLDIVRTGAM
jgi:hypothetical protein